MLTSASTCGPSFRYCCQREEEEAAWLAADLVPLRLQRLGSRDWFTSRTSACGILPRLYSRLGGRHGGGWGADGGKFADEDAKMDGEGSAAAALREEALELFKRLAADGTPLVRRAASTALADMGSALAGGTLSATGSAVGAEAAGEDDPMSGKAYAVGVAAAAAATGAAATGASSTRDGFNVDTGDITAAAVPPPVPAAIKVTAATQAAGAAATQALFSVLLAFSTDEQDSVRLMSVDGSVALARLLNGGNAPTTDGSAASLAILAAFTDVRLQLLQTVLTLGADKSWRVRWSVANRLSELAAGFGSALTTERLLPMFEVLLGVSGTAGGAAWRRV